MIQHLSDDELRARIAAKLLSGVLALQSPDETFGGPSAGQRCSACDEAIAAAEAEIEVERHDAPPQYFHARCYNLLRRARHGGQTPTRTRAARTTDKTRRGGLPAPVGYSRKPSLGDGSTCDGCDETIPPTEILFTVSFDSVSWQFHAECCEAWLTFKQE